MQTPTNSPNSRKRQSPISTKARQSWNNFRSLLGNRSPERFRLGGKSEFLLISADVTPRRSSSPAAPLFSKTGVLLLDSSKSPQADSANNSVLPLNPKRSQGIETLGEPFLGTQTPSVEPDDINDSHSQFSFDRKQSFYYYKTSEAIPRSRSPSLGTNSWSSADVGSFNLSLISNASLDYREPSECNCDSDGGSSYGESYVESYDWDEDAGLEDLVAEANQLPSDDEFAEELYRRRSAATSMHRQLSQITRDDLVVTFFDETRPKRTRSTVSTSSAVWPIQE